MHTFDPSTKETGRCISEFQVSLDYIVRACLKKGEERRGRQGRGGEEMRQSELEIVVYACSLFLEQALRLETLFHTKNDLAFSGSGCGE